MTVFLIVLGWLVCGVPFYFFHRKYWMHYYNEWSMSDRWFSIAVSVMGGPISSLLGFCLYRSTLDKSDYWDKPAKW